MLAVLSRALDVAIAISDVLEELFDFNHWREEWRRTASPVAYFLIFVAAFTLAVAVIMYGAAAIMAIKRALP